MAETLKSLRDNKGLSLEKVRLRMEAIAPNIAPESRQAVANWEIRGTKDVDVLRVLSIIYETPFEEVYAASLESRRLNPEKTDAQIVTKTEIFA